MPGLLSLLPVLSTKSAASGKTLAQSSKKERALVDRVAHSRFRSIAARVSPLHVVEDDEPVMSPLEIGSYRAKQVSEPLGDFVKENICHRVVPSPVSTKSIPTVAHEPNSVCLVNMVTDFMEDELVLKAVCGRVRCNCARGSCVSNVANGRDDDDEDDEGSSVGQLSTILQGLTKQVAAVEKSLLLEVVSVLDDVKVDSRATCEFNGDCSGGCVRRGVMSRLREKGFNAAICKTRWDHSRGLPGGDYEYIDVVLAGTFNDRLLVDIDFLGQFQIARPTNQYAAALRMVPPVYVGRADRLQQVVDLMTDATKRSLQKRSMHLPPWRRAEYMRAKWLAPYKRVTDVALLPCHAHGSLSREGSVKDGNSPSSTSSEKSTPTESPEVRTLVSSKLKEIQGTGNPESPIFLDLDLDVEVDAVIYKGKVFPVGDRLKTIRVDTEGPVHGGIELYKQQSVASRPPNQEEGPKRVEKVLDVPPPSRTKPEAVRQQRVMNTDWQPPSVKPRTPTASPGASGLASELRRSGLSSQLKSHVSLGTELRGEVDAVVSVRRTLSAAI